MEVKVNCGCGQKYKFDVEPVDGRIPTGVACPICGADGTEIANAFVSQHLANLAPRAIPGVLRVQAPVQTPGAAVADAELGSAEEAADATPEILVGARFCSNHPTSTARHICRPCKRMFCDMCVDQAARTCRRCGSAVAPVQILPVPTKSFSANLPGAFAYPFQGAGIAILICATIGISAMHFLSFGISGLIIRVVLYGCVFLFMQNIILTTTSNENEPLAFPEFSGIGGAALQLLGTVIASFWLSMALEIARFRDAAVPSEAIIASVILGGIYFPMALLAVAMKDTVLAANPLIVIPAMLRAPGNYSITAILTLAVFGIRQLGDMLSSKAGKVTVSTYDRDTFMGSIALQALWALLSVYLLVVTMRILGLFYNSSKQKLGWYNF
jgi:hypothetical protein